MFVFCVCNRFRRWMEMELETKASKAAMAMKLRPLDYSGRIHRTVTVTNCSSMLDQAITAVSGRSGTCGMTADRCCRNLSWNLNKQSCWLNYTIRDDGRMTTRKQQQ
ncbi:hypothetical protein pipiens_019607 [Culex pipiens pipiens]|uniref:Uncharacterized protein n=1 Tax=Culex pipiens pipiens TaxID=38569 RepID=A0ABD1DSZ2_CULPP